MVDVHARRAKAADGTDIVTIAWVPHGEGPFPRFAGELRTESLDTDRCTLTIAGDYQAPGDIAGAMFDAAVGITIARATLHRLLGGFRDAVQTDYAQRRDS